MRQATEAKQLIVNGETYDGDATTLAELIAALGYGEQRIATAVNGSFVAGDERAGYELRDGDKIEVVAPRQGG